MKLVDAPDSKSGKGNLVSVRVRPRAPLYIFYTKTSKHIKFIVEYQKIKENNMNYTTIKNEIENIKKEFALLDRDFDKEIIPCVDVFEFNKNVDMLKTKFYSKNNESDFFNNLFNTNDYYEEISLHLRRMNDVLKERAAKEGVSLEANKNIKNSLEKISDIIAILIEEYKESVKKAKANFINFNNQEEKEIKEILRDLTGLKEQMKRVLNYDSKIASNVVLVEFKNIFSFLTSAITVAKKRKDELLLVEIADATDRIMQIINPVFSSKSLVKTELIYHYLSYELQEIKASAVGEHLT